LPPGHCHPDIAMSRATWSRPASWPAFVAAMT